MSASIFGSWTMRLYSDRDPSLEHRTSGYFVPLAEVRTEGDAAKMLEQIAVKLWAMPHDVATLRNALEFWLREEATRYFSSLAAPKAVAPDV